MPQTARGLVISTIGDLIDENHKLGAFCLNTDCRHNVELNLPALAERLGRDHGSTYEDLAPKLRCSKCGEKRVKLQLRPPVPPASR